MHEQIKIGTLAMKKQNIHLLSQVEKAKQDPAAFTVLYREYAARVYRYIYARVSNHQDAEDLTSQVFEAALTGLSRFNGNKNFSAWLFTIARNKVVDSYRNRSTSFPLDAIQNMAGDTPDPLKFVLESETLAALTEMVSTLPPDKQELIHLRFAGGLSYAEMGEMLGKTESAVKMSVHRLLHQMQKEMEQNNE